MLSARRCAVLGKPIAHSLSPVLHRAGYAAAGLDWSYDAIEVGSDELAGFLDGLDDTWRGLSLTMPLKRTVVPLVDELTERIREASAFVPLERLALSPQCGFATSILGNALTIDDEVAKLRTIAETARAVWG